MGYRMASRSESASLFRSWLLIGRNWTPPPNITRLERGCVQSTSHSTLKGSTVSGVFQQQASFAKLLRLVPFYGTQPRSGVVRECAPVFGTLNSWTRPCRSPRTPILGYPTIGCIAERCLDGSHRIHPVDPASTIHFVAERRLKPRRPTHSSVAPRRGSSPISEPGDKSTRLLSFRRSATIRFG